MLNLPKLFHSFGEPMKLATHLTTNATIETTKAVQAFHNGLVSDEYPHFDLLLTLCALINKLDDLYDYEEELTYQRCPNTGAYVDNEELLAQLSKEIERTQQEMDIAELNLANAITSSLASENTKK